MLWKALHCENIISTDKTWLQGDPHLIVNLHRLVKPLNLIQHFHTAFRTLDGFSRLKDRSLVITASWCLISRC